MSVFTKISEEQLIHYLEHFELGHLTHFEGIHSGTANSNFFVTTTHGRYVLTLFERLCAGELEFYFELLHYLHAAHFPCAPPICNQQGQFIENLCAKPAAIMPRLAGVMQANVTAVHTRAIGNALAKLHINGLNFPKRHPNPFDQRWLNQTARALLVKLAKPLSVLLNSELTMQNDIDWSVLPKGIIHADLFRDNALFKGETLTGIIDFYYACYDCLLIDIAVVVNDWCLDETYQIDPVRFDALMDAYCAKRPLTQAENDLFHMALRASALRYWLSRLDALYHTPANEHILTKDPEEFQHILMALRSKHSAHFV